MTKAYCYVGTPELFNASQPLPPRQRVEREQDILCWIDNTQQRLDVEGSIIATFIIDTSGQLWIADRHSEHVQCARGQAVLSAGEITFTLLPTGVVVSDVSNQSTGYCPEPQSWQAVASALEQTKLPYPSGFTHEFTFRRCEKCGTTNVVKDDWFVCRVCDGELLQEWNYG